MIETLHIQNFALIDSLEVDFEQGFNALTGETGAGKSIILGALNLVLGGRASADVVREGAKQAKIDVVFRLDKPAQRLRALLQEHSIECDDGQLMITRIITAEGRSRAYVSGSLTPINVLADIGDELVDLHGQHEHQSLLKLDRQLDLLDVFADAEALAAQVHEQVIAVREMEKAIAQLETDDRELARRLEFLRFEAQEISQAGLEPGEEEECAARQKLITNAERIASLSAQVHAVLYEGEQTPAVDMIDTALRALEELGELDGRFVPLVEQAISARTMLTEVAEEARRVTDHLDFDPGELDNVNARLALIRNLKRKYGGSITEILAYMDRAMAEIESIENRDRRLADMQTALKTLVQNATETAQKLSAIRRKTGQKLEKQVSEALQDLGMKGGQFLVQFEQAPLSSRGMDRVEFMLSANVGEKPKSLRQVASGGEISRIMLALKAALAASDRIPSLIFDEIDAGVGGNVARSVAEKLQKLARTHQVICITHLAQIASAAQAHYHVAKTAQKGRTSTSLKRVEGDTRVEEIARLLDGTLSDASIHHARTMLQ